MDDVVQLPGGFQVGDDFVRQVEFRELSGAEEEILVDSGKKHTENSKGKVVSKSFSERITDILARCTVRIGEKVCEDNRTPKKASAKPFFELWSNAFVGDRSVALVRLRQLSLGNSYVWQDVCPACKHELARVSYDLSEAHIQPYFSQVDEELKDDELEGEALEENKRLIEERRVELLTQEVHEVRAPSGAIVRYRLLRRPDEEKLSSVMEKRPESIISALLAFRIVSIDGEKLNGTVGDPHIKFMSSRDRDFLRLYFDEVEGGLDATVLVECDRPMCGHRFTRRLDPSKPGFFHRLGNK